MEWLTVGGLCFSLWFALVAGIFPVNLSPVLMQVAIVFPVYLLIAFGCFSLAVVGYRVYSFNDCVAASQSLQKEILEAREDLKRKGFRFSDQWRAAREKDRSRNIVPDRD